jgi:hypothetical protein
MKTGLEKTSKRIKPKQGKITEVEATVTHDGKIQYEEDGQQKEYVVDNYADFRVAHGMCQTEGVEAMEVSSEFFQVLAHGKETPFIIYGQPAVKVFPQGKMEKGLKILTLSRDKYMELLSKKAKEDSLKKKVEEDQITSLD